MIASNRSSDVSLCQTYSASNPEMLLAAATQSWSQFEPGNWMTANFIWVRLNVWTRRCSSKRWPGPWGERPLSAGGGTSWSLRLFGQSSDALFLVIIIHHQTCVNDSRNP